MSLQACYVSRRHWSQSSYVFCEHCCSQQDFSDYAMNGCKCIYCNKEDSMKDTSFVVENYPICFKDKETREVFEESFESMLALAILMGYTKKCKQEGISKQVTCTLTLNTKEIHIIFIMDHTGQLEKISLRAYENGKDKGYFHPTTFNNTSKHIQDIFEKVEKLL